jgi:GTP-binding protein
MAEQKQVIVTGRANAGKSTLLNAVAVTYLASQGKTKMLNFFRVGAPPGNLVLVDAPGYGARGRLEWGALFDAYVEQRKELRRIYILFNAKHGISQVDEAMLESLDARCQASHLTLQAVITKADAIPRGRAVNAILKMRAKVLQAAPTCLPAIVTSANMKPPFGIEEVRKSIAEACGLI